MGTFPNSLASYGMPVATPLWYRYNKLTNIVYQGSSEVHYAYNPNGNLTNMIDSIGTMRQTYDNMNRLVAVIDHHGYATWSQYDRAGNRTNLTYSYDFENRLLSFGNGYDGAGYNTLKSGMPIILDRQSDFSPILQLRNTNSYSLNCTYISGPNGVFAEEHCGTHYFLLRDEMGSIIAQADTDGNVTGQITYSPYGETLQDEGINSGRHLYMGSYGVTYEGNNVSRMNARFYHSGLKLFLTPDPIGLDGGFNLYLYANGNPAYYVDPSGLDVWIEGSTLPDEPAGHISLGVGNPEDFYRSFSYGVNPESPLSLEHGITAEVYEDYTEGGKIHDGTYYKTSRKTDFLIMEKLQTIEGKKGPYRALNSNCRTWTKTQHEIIVDELVERGMATQSTPPNRPVKRGRYRTGISSLSDASRTVSSTMESISSSSDAI